MKIADLKAPDIFLVMVGYKHYRLVYVTHIQHKTDTICKFNGIVLSVSDDESFKSEVQNHMTLRLDAEYQNVSFLDSEQKHRAVSAIFANLMDVL